MDSVENKSYLEAPTHYLGGRPAVIGASVAAEVKVFMDSGSGITAMSEEPVETLRGQPGMTPTALTQAFIGHARVVASLGQECDIETQSCPLQLAIEMPWAPALGNMWLFGGLVDKQLSEGVANAMIRTTTAPTMLEGSIKENVLPQRARAIVNFRIHPNDTPEDVTAHASAIASRFDVKVAPVAGGIGSPASPVSPTSNRAYSVLSAVAARTGEGALAVPGLVIGATDARFASKISDNVYRFVPSLVSLADTAGFHGTNERLSVANMGRMSEGYGQIILAMDAQ